MPAELFHTRDMTAAVRALAERYKRVIVRNRHVLWNRIRLNRRALVAFNPRVVGASPAWDGELNAWNRDGGLLIFNRRWDTAENIAAHHAAFFVECPFDRRSLERMMLGTREVAVVYRPPHWREHANMVADLYPDAKLCRRVYQAMREGPRPSDEMLRAIGRVEDGRLVTDKGLAAALGGFEWWQVKRLRDNALRIRERTMVVAVTLRWPPDDPTLRKVYDFIECECPQVGHEHIVAGDALDRVTRRTRESLRRLERAGSIACGEESFFYPMDGLAPDWERMERAHRIMAEEWRQMAAYVDSTPEFILPAKRRPRARPAASPRSSAASP